MTQPIKIDIVSDVVCPWCAIGYGNLAKALEQLKDQLSADIQWHPFQLNPHMPAEGQEINEHLGEKYGLNEAQLAENKQRIVDMGKLAGVDFKFEQRSRIFNTLKCHILLHWAGEKGKQTELKLALFAAYFTRGENLNSDEVLVAAVKEAGLDTLEAQIVLKDEQYKKVVLEEESKYKHMGIQSVPAFIINDQYLISGGQPADAFVQALSDIASR